MSLAALEDIEDAIEATKRFLVPFDRVQWLRLAVVMFFVGGSGLSLPNFPSGGFGDGTETGGPDPGAPSGVTPEVTPELVTLAVGIVAVVIGLYLLYSVLAATMQFVFVDSLRQEEVRLKRYASRHARRGARLFAFRLGVWTLTLVALGALTLGVGTAVGGWPPTGWHGGAALSVVLVALPAFGIGALTVSIFLGFTTVFVVPVMLAEDRTVLSAWRRFWPTLTGQWKEYLAYLVMSVLLGIAVGIASSFLTLLVAVVLAIPFAVVGIPLAFVLGLSSAGALVTLVLGLSYAVLAFVAILLVQVPFQTFLRYYALLVLGDTNEAFDVIPDARAAVRTDGGDDGEGTAGADDDPDGGDGAGTDNRFDPETDDLFDDWNVDHDDDRDRWEG